MIMFKSLSLAAGFVFATQIANAATTRCGWFVNPTPANTWLLDAHGEWIIATQGGLQADGDWPAFSARQWIRTARSSSYGYGCACMKVETSNSRVTTILGAKAKPLSACRNDAAVSGLEPSLR